MVSNKIIDYIHVIWLYGNYLVIITFHYIDIVIQHIPDMRLYHTAMLWHLYR